MTRHNWNADDPHVYVERANMNGLRRYLRRIPHSVVNSLGENVVGINLHDASVSGGLLGHLGQQYVLARVKMTIPTKLRKQSLFVHIPRNKLRYQARGTIISEGEIFRPEHQLGQGFLGDLGRLSFLTVGEGEAFSFPRRVFSKYEEIKSRRDRSLAIYDPRGRAMKF
jgi:hypothetical protein